MQAADEILERAILHVLNAHKPAARDSARGAKQLTMREHEVLGLILRGHSSRKIGEMLFIEAKSVKFHVTNILKRLGYKTRFDLVASEFQKVPRKSA